LLDLAGPLDLTPLSDPSLETDHTGASETLHGATNLARDSFVESPIPRRTCAAVPESAAAFSPWFRLWGCPALNDR